LDTNKTIYIIRHGETEYNKLGIIQGSGIDSDLNETGFWQARQFFRAYHHIPFSKIYTSNLKRTHQTIQPFLEKGILHEELAELNEINWGIFEGQEITPECHREYLKVVNEWKDGLLHKRIEGGESPQELWERQTIALQKIMSRPEEEHVLIAMHGRAMKSFLCLLSGVSQTNMEDFRHNNLCLYLVEYTPESGYKVTLENATDHLRV
jgi:probable phosphoglycerate mutase